jgi:hypothetical protein
VVQLQFLDLMIPKECGAVPMCDGSGCLDSFRGE